MQPEMWVEDLQASCVGSAMAS